MIVQHYHLALVLCTHWIRLFEVIVLTIEAHDVLFKHSFFVTEAMFSLARSCVVFSFDALC